MRLRRKKVKPRVEMLPLMDVVFLLLVFFIYSMLTMAVHRGVALTLPVSGTAERETRTSPEPRNAMGAGRGLSG